MSLLDTLHHAAGSTFVARWGLVMGAVAMVCTSAHDELEKLIGPIHDPICGVAIITGVVLAYLGKSDFDRRKGQNRIPPPAESHAPLG